MNFAILRRFAVNRNAKFFHHLAQLGVDILPFAHAQIVEIIGTTQATEGVGRKRLLLLAKIIPQIYKREEVGFFVVEATMFFVRCLLFVHRTFARILNGERGRDNHRLTHAAMFLRFQHHTRQTWVDRQLRELATERRQFIGAGLFIRGDRAQFFEQTHAILDIAFIRCFDKRERSDIAQPQRGHLQNNRGQVGTQNLRIGKLRARKEIVFGIETNTDPFGHTPTAAFTLIGRRLRNGFNRQTLHFGAIAVAADTRCTGVDDVFNPRYGQRGFRDVGRQHNAPSAVRLEHAVLFAVRKPRIKRQDFGMTQI